MATKQQILAKLESQDWILTEAQKPKFRSFLRDYTVEPEDLPFLRKIAKTNNIDIDKFKDSALFEKIKNDVTVKVEDAVAVLDEEDKHELKKDRYTRLTQHLPYTFTRGQYEITVTDLQVLDVGIAVFVRVFRNGKQIGFGKDGTVDIERIIMTYLPVLVHDPAGDIERLEINEHTGERTVRRLTENPRRALENYLVKILKAKQQVHGNENIIAGKVGNTTTTARPAAGQNEPVDGRPNYGTGGSGTGVAWSTFRAASGNGTNDTSANTILAAIYSDTVTDRWRFMYRSIFGFDTSAIPDTDDIDSATFTLTSSAIRDDAFNLEYVLDRTVPTSTDQIVAGDYDIGNWDGVEQASNRIAGSVMGSNTDHTWTLNATGLGNISKTGLTWFGIRNDADFDNVEPTWASNVNSSASIYFADQTGTADDPVLVIEHSAGGGGEARNAIFAFGGM